MSEEPNSDIKTLTTCQNCGADDPNLSTIDSGLKLALAKSGQTEIPAVVCANCLKTLRKSASQGAQLQAKEEAENKNKVAMWRGRTELVKQGRRFLTRGEYAEAAISYEKYLKVVTLVVQKNKGELDPKLFSDHPKEITIISSVLWDLMLIYDSHVKFQVKQMEIVDVLARFLRFSPVYNGIIRRAEKQVRSSKNPQAFKQLLKLCDASASRCFVANAVFETRVDPHVQILCQFRDQILRQSDLGRRFIIFYYKHSPQWVHWLNKRPHLKGRLRALLQRVAILLQRIFNLPERRDS